MSNNTVCMLCLIGALSLSTSACSMMQRTPMPTLAITASNHCADPAGVAMRGNAVTIALGSRPTTGYGVDLVNQAGRVTDMVLTFQEKKPAPNTMQGQMMTSPCLQIMLPTEWQKLTVIDQESQQHWHFSR
ncbi:MAG: protease complex subunit PrcB family protein [Bacterioplanes sp.]|nr:protease complex subunit PrcB family protein [Bacterioplanes sp.]